MQLYIWTKIMLFKSATAKSITCTLFAVLVTQILQMAFASLVALTMLGGVRMNNAA